MIVQLFLRRENNRWLGWKRITQNILSMEDKMAAGAFGRARNCGRDGMRTEQRNMLLFFSLASFRDWKQPPAPTVSEGHVARSSPNIGVGLKRTVSGVVRQMDTQLVTNKDTLEYSNQGIRVSCRREKLRQKVSLSDSPEFLCINLYAEVGKALALVYVSLCFINFVNCNFQTKLGTLESETTVR